MMAEVGEQAKGLCGGGLSRIIFVARDNTGIPTVITYVKLFFWFVWCRGFYVAEFYPALACGLRFLRFLNNHPIHSYFSISTWMIIIKSRSHGIFI